MFRKEKRKKKNKNKKQNKERKNRKKETNEHTNEEKYCMRSRDRTKYCIHVLYENASQNKDILFMY